MSSSASAINVLRDILHMHHHPPMNPADVDTNITSLLTLDSSHKDYCVKTSDWLLNELSKNQRPRATRTTYTGPPFVPTLKQIESLPSVIGDITLTSAQKAVVLANTFSPTRSARVTDTMGEPILENNIETPVGVRPMLRFVFAPTGMGKTTIGILSGIMSVLQHYDTYAQNDLWRVDEYGGLQCVRPIAPVVLCIASPIIYEQWIRTAKKCAQAFPKGKVSVFPKDAYDKFDARVLLDAARSAKVDNSAVVYIVTSDRAKAFYNKFTETMMPMTLVMDEVSHDGCYLRHDLLPFTLLITASSRAFENSLLGSRNNSMLRTIFKDMTAINGRRIAPYARLAACDVGFPYYRHLVESMTPMMPQRIQGISITVSGSAMGVLVHNDMDPTLSVSLASLCRWISVPFDGEKPALCMTDVLNFRPTTQQGLVNYKRMYEHFREDSPACLVCMRCVKIEGATSPDEDDMIESGNMLITGCCSRMICTRCCGCLVRKICPQCSVPLNHPGAHRLDLDAPIAPNPARSVVGLPSNRAELSKYLAEFETNRLTSQVVISTVLDAMYSAGIRRVLLSWSMNHLAVDVMQSANRVFCVIDSDEAVTGKRRRAANADLIDYYRRGAGADRMAVLVINSRCSGSQQVIAGLDLPSDAVILTGRHDHAQIIARVVRPGSTEDVFVVDVVSSTRR